jgi:hypothetical protein
MQRHLPPSHAHRDTPTPPSPPAVPVHRVSLQTLDKGGLYTSPHASATPRSTHARVPSAGGAVGPLPNSHAIANLPPPPVDQIAATGSGAGHMTAVASNSPYLPQNRPHPSTMHAQHTWNHSPDLAKSRPTTVHAFQQQPPLPVNYTPHELSPLQPHPPGPLQPHPQCTAESMFPAMQSLGIEQQDSSCVRVQVEVEPEVVSYTHSRDTGESAATIRDNTATRPQLIQSRSHPNLTMQADSNSIPRPMAFSTNTPTLPSNLHVSMSLNQSSALLPGGRVVMRDAVVDVPTGSAEAVNQMRRLGHSRHLSLGRNLKAPSQRPSHTRHRSLGSITSQALPFRTLNSAHGSCSNLSIMSNAGSETAASSFLTASQLTQLPDREKGYDFAKHFNVFSPYTSNMALEYCVSLQESETRGPFLPPVWCMAFSNRVVAVGCSNGQLEVRVGME